MIQNWNLFWVAIGSIGQAIGAIATAAAVIVTLFQIRIQNDKKLKLKYTKDNCIVPVIGNEMYCYINLSVTNIGNRNVIIKSWGITYSKEHGGVMIPDRTNPMLCMLQVSLPKTLVPEESIDLVFDFEKFKNNLKQQVDKGICSKGTHLRFYVIDSAGKEYSVRDKHTIASYLQE